MHLTNFHFYSRYIGTKNYHYSKRVKGLKGYRVVYRFAFNGKEKDNEGMGGGGSTYDYGFRIYNPNLGKFLSVDPLTKSYPWNSTYAFAENDVIRCIDLDGLEKFDINIVPQKDGTSIAQIKLTCIDTKPQATITENGVTINTQNNFKYKKLDKFINQFTFQRNAIFLNGKEISTTSNPEVSDSKDPSNQCKTNTPDFNFKVNLTACDLNTPSKISLTENVGKIMIVQEDMKSIEKLAANGQVITNVSNTSINQISVTAKDQASANSLISVLLKDPNVKSEMIKTNIDSNVTGGFATYQTQQVTEVDNNNPPPCE